MIKVGILGADSPVAGEIIRILIKHPETDLVSLYAPRFVGHNVTTKHHGLIGEPQLNFSDKLNLDEVDLVFIAEESELSEKIIEQFGKVENLKIISLDQDFLKNLEEVVPEVGLSEINRKALVRGARISYLSSPFISPSLVALSPLADFLLLNSDIDIEIFAPEDMLETFDCEKEGSKLKELLKLHQSSFNADINLNLKSNPGSGRGMMSKIKMKSSVPEEELIKIYEGIYDDHNFTFLSPGKVNTDEVEGTQKIVINLEKPSADLLTINVVSDARLRGGAGDAVHVMNLFFGLHEKTGLHFKPSRF